MFKSGAIKQRVFSIYISNSKKNNQDGSRFVIGGYDSEKYAKKGVSKIHWNPIANENYWSLSLSKAHFTYGAKSLSKEKEIFSSQTLAILDSGTRFIIIPKKDHS